MVKGERNGRLPPLFLPQQVSTETGVKPFTGSSYKTTHVATSSKHFIPPGLVSTPSSKFNPKLVSY